MVYFNTREVYGNSNPFDEKLGASGGRSRGGAAGGGVILQGGSVTLWPPLKSTLLQNDIWQFKLFKRNLETGNQSLALVLLLECQLNAIIYTTRRPTFTILVQSARCFGIHPIPASALFDLSVLLINTYEVEFIVQTSGNRFNRFLWNLVSVILPPRAGRWIIWTWIGLFRHELDEFESGLALNWIESDF